MVKPVHSCVTQGPRSVCMSACSQAGICRELVSRVLKLLRGLEKVSGRVKNMCSTSPTPLGLGSQPLLFKNKENANEVSFLNLSLSTELWS